MNQMNGQSIEANSQLRYALTGCVISEDKSAIIEAKDALTHSA